MAATAGWTRVLELIDRYEIHREIGAGGMATVYLARTRNASGASRTVAVKRLHRHMSTDPRFVKMFIDEARLATRVHHANVVTTLDVVTTEHDIALVMEYVHGDSLAGVLRAMRSASSAIPLPIVSSIVCGALAGLHAAHEAKSERGEPLGLVHRDVSPQNILVGADGVTKVLDFGIAKAAGRSTVTRDGSIKGKLAYLAPELLMGMVPDRRADVFAMGVVLWEAVTGERLFGGGDGTPGVVLQAVLGRPVPRPSELRSETPASLDDVVLRTLDRQRELRFQTAREMAVALEAAVTPASAREVGDWLERVLGPELRARAAEVAAVEAGDPVLAAGVVTGVVSRGALEGTSETPTPEGVRPPAADLDDTVHDASPPVSAAPPAPSRPRRTRVLVRFALAVGWLVAVAIATLLLRYVAPAPSPSPAEASSSAPSETVLAHGAPPASSAVVSEVGPDEGDLGATAAIPTTPASAGSRVRPPVPRRRAAGPHRGASCATPFTVDDAGIRIPRPECF
ncbi:MAG: serine/threonine protein kinase [Labilithrix sp.]|nr:serine/threonine protein kinase [Labilithrix sp.]